jgi:hypothetical protein
MVVELKTVSQMWFRSGVVSDAAVSHQSTGQASNRCPISASHRSPFKFHIDIGSRAGTSSGSVQHGVCGGCAPHESLIRSAARCQPLRYRLYCTVNISGGWLMLGRTSFTRQWTRSVYVLGLVIGVLVSCQSPPTNPVPPNQARSSSADVSYTEGAPAATPVLAGSSPGVTGETSEAACPITPYAESLPPDPHPAGFTTTWLRNDDGSLWAGLAPPYQGAWYAGADGLKVQWWRATGFFSEDALMVEGQRLDRAAPPLQAEIPCCYPSRYQAVRLSLTVV